MPGCNDGRLHGSAKAQILGAITAVALCFKVEREHPLFIHVVSGSLMIIVHCRLASPTNFNLAHITVTTGSRPPHHPVQAVEAGFVLSLPGRNAGDAVCLHDVPSDFTSFRGAEC